MLIFWWRYDDAADLYHEDEDTGIVNNINDNDDAVNTTFIVQI